MMTEEEFQRISSFVKQNYGIDMHEKKEIVRGRLESHLSLIHISEPTRR